MIVYCGDERCIHNKDGVCENKFPTGEEAIYLIETLGGSVICFDQREDDDDE